uniref:hypothetical protein n=1 Tax=Treponema zioleckii TaxID=331680 RepID=UPI001A92C09A
LLWQTALAAMRGEPAGRTCKGYGRRVKPVCLKTFCDKKNMGKSSLPFLFCDGKQMNAGEKSII